MLTQEQKQDFFDRAVTGLASQGFRRCTEAGGNGCQYRRGDMKCAVGHLLPDDMYHETMEGSGIYWETGRDRARGDDVLVALGVDHTDRATVDYFSELQACHDTAYATSGLYTKVDKPADMILNLRDFASKHDLQVPEVLK